MATAHLREGDVDLVLRVIEEGRSDDPGEAIPWAVLEGLQRLIPCDLEVSYLHQDHVLGQVLIGQSVTEDGARLGPDHPPPEGPDHPFWRTWWQSLPSWPQRTGNLREVIHSGTYFATDRERRNDPMREVFPQIGYGMIVSLPAPPGEVRRITFVRTGGPPFTERDRQIGVLLRPHLQEIWLDAERRRNGIPRLTPREWQVLALVADGLSSAQIARALFVSVSTVRKHAEHIRERLGVSSISAAAATALPLLPPAPPPTGAGLGREAHDRRAD